MNKFTKGAVNEIFSSIQGEGLRLGERQIFVRLAGCNLRCSYCDTKHTENPANSRLFSVDQTIKTVSRLNERRRHKYIAVTGGEPLLQFEYLSILLPRLKQKRFSVMLETNGCLFAELERVKGYCDLISMDIKPFSVCGVDNLAKHLEFIKAGAGKIYAKFVIGASVSFSEACHYLNAIAKRYADLPVVLQPVTVCGKLYEGKNIDIFNLYKKFSAKFKKIYIIPQHQVIWGIR